MRRAINNKKKRDKASELAEKSGPAVSGRGSQNLNARLSSDLSSVHETARLLTSPMELQQVLEVVVRTVAEALDADAAGLRLLDEETGELRLKATYGLSESYKNKGPVTAGESTLNERALRGEAIVVEDMRRDSHFQKYHEAIGQEGLVSNLSIGLMYRGKGIGIMRLYSKGQRRFGQEDISLARTVASQSAAAITNARLYAEALEGERIARQLRLAGAVQRHLIPRETPQRAGVELAGHYAPCYDVGGDFYDYIPLADGRLIIVIGDVMGKGVPASLAMASLRSSLRAYAEQSESVEELVARANGMFCHDIGLGEFATLFCASLDPTNDRLVYCNCGHEPPIVLRGGRQIDLDQGGTVLGIDPESKYVSAELELEAGDLVLMYTDGLADAVNFEGEPFGRERVIESLRASAQMNAAQVGRNILWLMRKFTGLTPPFDDTALVILKKTDAAQP